jgi:hypothetical protein
VYNGKILEYIVRRENVDVLVPVCWCAVNAGADPQDLDGVAIVARVVFPHAVAIDDVEAGPFAAYQQQVRVRAGLIGEKQGTAGADIEVVGVQLFLVEGGEEIADQQAAFAER